MKVLFRVYRRYFDLIQSGEKPIELRAQTEPTREDAPEAQ